MFLAEKAESGDFGHTSPYPVLIWLNYRQA